MDERFIRHKKASGAEVMVRSTLVGTCGGLAAGTTKAAGLFAVGKGVAGGAALLSPVGFGLALGALVAAAYAANAVRYRR
ncbi:MAG: hypothetical protein H7841_11105 [Magnetospirillum sp. WYHS-4]